MPHHKQVVTSLLIVAFLFRYCPTATEIAPSGILQTRVLNDQNKASQCRHTACDRWKQLYSNGIITYACNMCLVRLHISCGKILYSTCFDFARFEHPLQFDSILFCKRGFVAYAAHTRTNDLVTSFLLLWDCSAV